MDHGDSAVVEACVTALRRAMWADGGLLRSEPLLQEGLRSQAENETGVELFAQRDKVSRVSLEAQSLCSVARAILCSALARKESRGAHFRNDYPNRNDTEYQKHSICTADGLVRFEDL